jgi:hypothetical protein
VILDAGHIVLESIRRPGISRHGIVIGALVAYTSAGKDFHTRTRKFMTGIDDSLRWIADPTASEQVLLDVVIETLERDRR